MLKNYKISNDRIVEATKDENPNILLYINPNANEKKAIIENYKIDEHSLNSTLDPDELSRLDFEDNHAEIIFKIPKNYSSKNQLLFRSTTMGVFYYADILIIIMTEDIPLFDIKQFNKVNSLQEIVLKLIYRAIHHFFEHLRVFNQISDQLEQKINKSMENKYLLNLFTLEKSIVYYLYAINSNGVLLEKVKHNATKLNLNTTDNADLLEDIIIENNQCYRQAEIYSNILASLMDARASIVSNNLNILMKLLNIITIGIMVPTFIVSAFSMNVKIPLADLDYAFWIVIGLATASVIIFTLILKNQKW